jgi:hypothetical protein
VIPQQGRAGRLTIASLAAVIMALCIWLLFPDFYRGTFVAVDPRIVPVWLNKVIEVQSPLSKEFLTPLIQLIGSAIVGILYIGFVLWKEPHKNLRGWIFILSGIVLFVSVGMFERRLFLYGNIMTIVPLTALLGRVLIWEFNHVKHLTRTLIRPLTIISFCVIFLFVGYVCQNIIEKDSVLEGKDRLMPLSQVCDELNKLNINQGRPTRILACIDYGPEILYRTQCEIVGTPHHRNAQGILDTFKIMTAESDDEAHELILKRKVDMIVISNSPGERNFVSAPYKRSTLYERLRTEGSVDWLRAVELPPHLSPSYRLFRVIG